MSTLRQITSARANGARSRGPVTAAGKARSSQNAIRHGLLAKCVVISNESPDGFKAMHDQFVHRFDPVDGVEDGLLEEMVAASWRLRRAWAIETRILDDALDSQPSGDELGRVAAAFRSVASRPELALVHRYETRLHSMFQRALHNLLLLRASGLPNEPDSVSPAPALLPPSPVSNLLLPGAPGLPSEPDSVSPDPTLLPPDPVSSLLLPGACGLPNEPDSVSPAPALLPPDPPALHPGIPPGGPESICGT